MDMAARGPETTFAAAHPVTLNAIRANIGPIENPGGQRTLLIAVDHADGDLQQLQMTLRLGITARWIECRDGTSDLRS